MIFKLFIINNKYYAKVMTCCIGLLGFNKLIAIKC